MTAWRDDDPAQLLRDLLTPASSEPPTLQGGQVTDVDADTGTVMINLGGNDQPAALLAYVPLQVGDVVLTLRARGVVYIVAPISTFGPGLTGTVSAIPTDSDTITVTTPTGDVDAMFTADYTPTVGDSVLLVWAGSTPIAWKQGVTGTPPSPTPKPPPPVPPKPPAPPQTGTTTFQASESGTYRGGEWLSESIAGGVVQGNFGYGDSEGAWFYGGRPKATLAGATVKSAQIYLSRTQGGVYAAQTAHLERVTNDKRPGGAPTFDGAHTHDVSIAVGQSGWYSIPASMAQAVVDSGGSIGIKGSPYLRLNGMAQSGQAGALKITWSR